MSVEDKRNKIYPKIYIRKIIFGLDIYITNLKTAFSVSFSYSLNLCEFQNKIHVKVMDAMM